MTAYRIFVIRGGGIGTEMMPEAIAAVVTAGTVFGHSFDRDETDRSFERFHKTGAMMPEDGLEGSGFVRL